MVAYYDDTICLCNMLMVASCGVYFSFTKNDNKIKLIPFSSNKRGVCGWGDVDRTVKLNLKWDPFS